MHALNPICPRTTQVAEELPAAKALFDKASDILGYDLLERAMNGPKDVLDSTVRVYVVGLDGVVSGCSREGEPPDRFETCWHARQAVSQPAIFVASAAAIEKLKATEGADVANSATVRCEDPPLPCRLKLKNAQDCLRCLHAFHI